MRIILTSNPTRPAPFMGIILDPHFTNRLISELFFGAIITVSY